MPKVGNKLEKQILKTTYIINFLCTIIMECDVFNFEK